MLQKKLRTVIIQDFMGKLLSEIILGLGKCTYTFTFMHFLVGAIPEVRNNLQKQFSHKVLYNLCSKNFFGAFWSVFKKVKKMDFLSYFQNMICQGGRGIFLTTKKS